MERHGNLKKMPDANILAIYVRVSTREQLRGYSIEGQERKIRQFIELYDFEGEIRIYSDAGKSAKTLNRPAMKQLLEDIEAGKVKYLVVHKLDRLVRRMKDMFLFLEYIRDGLRISSVEEMLDTSKAIGRNHIYQIVANAELEQDRISERVKDGYESAYASGSFVRPVVPIGYIKTKEKKLVIDPDTVDIVLKIFAMSYEGNSLAKIVAYLNSLEFFIKRGKKITDTKLNRMLNDSIYYGCLIYNNDEYWNIAEPIVSKEYFDEVNIKRSVHFKKQLLEYPYRGIVKCSCGEFLRCEYGKGRKGVYYYYYKCGKCNKRINETIIDEYVNSYMYSEVTENKNTVKQEKYSYLSNNIKMGITSAFEMFEGKEINIETYISLNLKYANELQALNLKYKKELGNFANDFNKLDREEKNKYYIKMIHEIIVDFRVMLPTKIVLKNSKIK